MSLSHFMLWCTAVVDLVLRTRFTMVGSHGRKARWWSRRFQAFLEADSPVSNNARSGARPQPTFSARDVAVGASLQSGEGLRSPSSALGQVKSGKRRSAPDALNVMNVMSAWKRSEVGFKSTTVSGRQKNGVGWWMQVRPRPWMGAPA